MHSHINMNSLLLWQWLQWIMIMSSIELIHPLSKKQCLFFLFLCCTSWFSFRAYLACFHLLKTNGLLIHGSFIHGSPLTDNHSWILDKKVIIPFLCSWPCLENKYPCSKTPPSPPRRGLVKFYSTSDTKLQRLGNQVPLFLASTLLSISYSKEKKKGLASFVTSWNKLQRLQCTHPFGTCNTPNKRVWQASRIG